MNSGSGGGGGGGRKRRHPDESYTESPKSSFEILPLIENPNFEELARHYPRFRAAWNETRQNQHAASAAAASNKTNGIHSKRKSFSSAVTQEFTVALTRALLQAYFHLKLPYLMVHNNNDNNDITHLCPPVPNRFFYLHWIQTHLLTQQYIHSGAATGAGSGRNGFVHWGLDLGTGATCIYPLLASKFFGSNMVATDIDSNALNVAKSNVTANQLDHKIHLLQVPLSRSQNPTLPAGGPLQRALSAWNRPSTCFGFVMTNPPFYDTINNNNGVPSSSSYHITPRIGDGRARTNMTASEGTYPNGEIGFVTEMVMDSLQARNSAIWFSSMFGKKSSFLLVKKLLETLLGPGHIETTEYGPGQYTRWFLAWTFQQPLIDASLARVLPATSQQDVFPVTIESTSGPRSIATASVAVQEVVSRIVTFCDSSPGGWEFVTEQRQQEITSTAGSISVQLDIKESMPLAITNFVDETTTESLSTTTLPQCWVEALQGQDNSMFLPQQGHHFLIRATLQAAVHGAGDSTVRVEMEYYRHSSRGMKAIEKIRNSIQGEICRTNRKWRRIFKRQQQQPML